MPHMSFKSMIANMNLGLHTSPRTRTRTISMPRLDPASDPFQSLTAGDIDHVRIQGGDFVKVSEGMHFVLDLNGGQILVKVTRKFAETLPPPSTNDHTDNDDNRNDNDNRNASVPWFIFIEPGPNMSTLQSGNSFTLFIAGCLVLVEVTTILRHAVGPTEAEAEAVTPIKTWCVEGVNAQSKPHVLGTPLPSEKPLPESPKANNPALVSKNSPHSPMLRVLGPEDSLPLETETRSQYLEPSPTTRRRRGLEREAETNITHPLQEFRLGHPSPSSLGLSSLPLPRLKSGPIPQPYPVLQPSVKHHSFRVDAPVELVDSILMQSGLVPADKYPEARSISRSRGISRVRTTSTTRHRRTSSSSSSSSTQAQLGMNPQSEAVGMRTGKTHRKPQAPATSEDSPKSRFPSQLSGSNENIPYLPPSYPSPARSKRLSLPARSSSTMPGPRLISEAARGQQQQQRVHTPRSRNVEEFPRERGVKDSAYRDEKKRNTGPVLVDQSTQFAKTKPYKDSTATVTSVGRTRHRSTRNSQTHYAYGYEDKDKDTRVGDLMASTKTPLPLPLPLANSHHHYSPEPSQTHCCKCHHSCP